MDNFIFLPARSRKNAGNSATGKLSVALGQHCTASGEYSLADGSGCIASTACSVALGNAADASNTCGFMYRDMCGNTFCFDSGGHDLSGQLLINGKPIGGTQEATSGKIIVEHDEVFWYNFTTGVTGSVLRDGTASNLPKDNLVTEGAVAIDPSAAGTSLQQLLAPAGVTTCPGWIRLTFIGAGGGGGCGKWTFTNVTPRSGSGGGSGAIAIMESSGDLTQTAWTTQYPLSVGRGGWYNHSGTSAPPDLSNGGATRDTNPGWDFTWKLSNTATPHDSRTPWLWSGDGGNCTWGLPRMGGQASEPACAAGGKSGRGPSSGESGWTADTSNPPAVPNMAGGLAAALPGPDVDAGFYDIDPGWKMVQAIAGNQGEPFFPGIAQYQPGAGANAGPPGTSFMGTQPQNQDVTAAPPFQPADAYVPPTRYKGLEFVQLMWGVGGKTYTTRVCEASDFANGTPGEGASCGHGGMPGRGYGAGGSGDGGGAGACNCVSDDDQIVGIALGGAGADAALIIEWGPSRS